MGSTSEERISEFIYTYLIFNISFHKLLPFMTRVNIYGTL